MCHRIHVITASIPNRPLSHPLLCRPDAGQGRASIRRTAAAPRGARTNPLAPESRVEAREFETTGAADRAAADRVVAACEAARRAVVVQRASSLSGGEPAVGDPVCCLCRLLSVAGAALACEYLIVCSVEGTFMPKKSLSHSSRCN